MNEIFCLAEHRMGKVRDVTFEMLGKARELSGPLRADICAVILGYNMSSFAYEVQKYANKVIVVEDEGLLDFNSDAYQSVLVPLISERKPILTMIAHTAYGVDIAPSLAIKLDLPIATDCIDIEIDGGKLYVVRQMYGGKVNAKVSFRGAERYMVTIRQGVLRVKEGTLSGEIVRIGSVFKRETLRKTFVKYIEPEVGTIDITRFDKIVSVGRGIKEKKNLQIVEELAELIGAGFACSRPIVDARWLSVDRQVGQSGKTVKPKLYIAVGISGAFQHVQGMRDSETIIAINNDPGSPIFDVADYGVVEDIFKVLPMLCARIKETKTGGQ